MSLVPDTLRKVQAQLFASAWRIVWQQLSQQREVLRYLYNAAQTANTALPKPPIFNRADLTDEEAQALQDFFDDDGAARGARDAFATAIVMFLDDSFKMLTSFYERIPDIERNLAVRVEGIDLPKIVRDAANNVRHYQDWRVPAKDLLRPELALANATTIAALMGKAPPIRKTVSVWAANWAWPILAKISGGTFNGLASAVLSAMEEMLENAHETESEHVIEYRNRYPIPLE